jgi:hypothetical protein
VNAAVRSPERTSPATRGSRRHARAFTEPLDVVTHTRPAAEANTIGVTCGPIGVSEAT